jgi:hypothetical protein
MKQILLIGAVMEITSVTAHSQTIGTMLQQLGNLEQLRLTTQKGYNAVFDGLHEIGEIKAGEFHLHEAYFLSLNDGNPAITEQGRWVGALEGMQIDIMDAIYQAIQYYEYLKETTIKTK